MPPIIHLALLTILCGQVYCSVKIYALGGSATGESPEITCEEEQMLRRW